MEKLSFNCDDCVQNYQLEMCYIVGNFSIIVRITILFHFFPFTQFYSILLKSTQFYSNLLKFTQFTQLTVAYYISAQPIVLDRYVRCMSE